VLAIASDKEDLVDRVCRVRKLVVIILALFVASGCSSDRTSADLASSFSASKGGATRLYEQYEKSGSDGASVNVGRPGAGKLLAMRIDCVGEGKVDVQVGNVSIGADCPQDGSEGTLGRIGAQDLDGDNSLTVTPKGSGISWSVAVDLLPPVN
jgi:hypothetical protein